MYYRRQFLQHIAQTSEVPQGFEISAARGSYLFEKNGKAYMDLISGFGVNNIGHSVPPVLQAISAQTEKYLHTNVYGEHIQGPQLELATYLASLLPTNLNSFYFLNSGSECIDAAIKLSRIASSRHQIVVCRNAYHGSTIAAESLRSDTHHSNQFRPLMPSVRFINFNNENDLSVIDEYTAAVIIEVVQAEAGLRIATNSYLLALRKRCYEKSVLLVFDEIQTGIGRCGSLFAFQQYPVLPDILLCGKALGAGMPLAAMICDQKLMQYFNKKLPLAYITTFGGHPVCCAAGLAGLKYLIENHIIEEIKEKENLIRSNINNNTITEVRSRGLFFALELGSATKLMDWIRQLYNQQMLAEGFLFCNTALRIAPPLTISKSEILTFCDGINSLN